MVENISRRALIGGAAMIGAGTLLPSTVQALTRHHPPVRSTRILWAGTSSEAARWCGTGPKGMNGARDKGYVMLAGKRLEKYGIGVNTQGYFGEQNNDRSIDALTGYDRRLHDLHGLTVNPALSQMGGYPLGFPAGAETNYAIDFAQPGDTIYIYVSVPKAAERDGVLDYAIDDGAPQQIRFTDNKVQRVTISGLEPKLHSLRLFTERGENPANIAFHGAESFVSTNNDILFMPVGARAWNTSPRYWTREGGYSPIAMLPIIKADIVIATFGGGDTDEYGPFQERCEIWGDAVVAAGAKPVFVGKPYRNPAYYESIAALAEKYGTPTRNMGVIDEETAIRHGEKAHDNLHFLAPWHRREGEALGDWLYEEALPKLGVLS